MSGFVLSKSQRQKSVADVQFRAVIDNHDGVGELPISDVLSCRDTAEYAAEIFIRHDGASPDSTVSVQSSHTAADGTVTWQLQSVVKYPRGPKWKAYCESHTLCACCGQVLPKERSIDADNFGVEYAGVTDAVRAVAGTPTET